MSRAVRFASQTTTVHPRVRSARWEIGTRQDYERVASVRIAESPYIVAISLSELGRTTEVVPVLLELEHKFPSRLRDFAVAARTLIEGHPEVSIAAVERIVDSGFRDPEGLFYLSRHLAHLNASAAALKLLERVVASGYCCYPTMARDPWLDSLRKTSAFAALLRQTEALHQSAQAAFERVGGRDVLGLAPLHA